MSECIVRMKSGRCEMAYHAGIRGVLTCPVTKKKCVGQAEIHCPIIAVLPEKHGRLVDIDGLIKKINAARIRVMQSGGDTNPYWECVDLCLQTPTIVPATEGGKE